MFLYHIDCVGICSLQKNIDEKRYAAEIGNTSSVTVNILCTGKYPNSYLNQNNTVWQWLTHQHKIGSLAILYKMSNFFKVDLECFALASQTFTMSKLSFRLKDGFCHQKPMRRDSCCISHCLWSFHRSNIFAELGFFNRRYGKPTKCTLI